MKRAENAAAITRASKSNLAFAFISMSGQRRRDITTFYAFCRVIDNIADDLENSPQMKERELERWRAALGGARSDEPPLAPAVRKLIDDYPALSAAMFEEIIRGVEMDISPRRYATWEDLRVYCYRVASAVGLVSIEIFGYQNAQCREYAIALGLALQVTNIIRDVGTDLEAGRIYLPEKDFGRAKYSEEELRERVSNDSFRALMELEATRARDFFARAASLLPREDRRAMLPAEIMRSIYQNLLRRMERDHFQVLSRRYRLARIEKFTVVISAWIKNALNSSSAQPSKKSIPNKDYD